MTDQVRASRTNFGRTQSSYSRNQSFAQNSRIGIVENHHHQNHNHSDSLACGFLIKHTDDEVQVKLTNTNIYNNCGDLVKGCRDILIERLSYLMLQCVSARLLISLHDVAVWVEMDCGLKITEQDIRTTVYR